MRPRIQSEKSFYKSINAAISEGRHADYLKDIIGEYEDYKLEFEQNFTDGKFKNEVYVFKVSYVQKKNVWRTVEILGSQTFEGLSDVIVDSMRWQNDHLHGFSLPNPHAKHEMEMSPYTFYSPHAEDDQYPTFKTDEIMICDIDYKKNPKLTYMFDFGDGHLFDVEPKGRRPIVKGERTKDFPRLVDQRGVAPEQYPNYPEE